LRADNSYTVQYLLLLLLLLLLVQCSYYSATITAIAGALYKLVTKFKPKTVAQLNADDRRRSERTAPQRHVRHVTDGVSRMTTKKVQS